MVSVNQKLAGQGYLNNLPPPAGPVPSEYVRQAIAYADSSIGQLIAELEKNNILGKTVSCAILRLTASIRFQL